MYSLGKSTRSLFVFALLFGLLAVTENIGEAAGENVKSVFEVKYSAWRDWLREKRTLTPSAMSSVK
jgi:hypothetical protein